MDPMGYTMMQSSQYFAWTFSGYLGESFTETTCFGIYIETSPRHLGTSHMAHLQTQTTTCANWDSQATWASMSWTPNSSPPNESIFGLLPDGKQTYKHYISNPSMFILLYFDMDLQMNRFFHQNMAGAVHFGTKQPLGKLTHKNIRSSRCWLNHPSETCADVKLEICPK